MIYNAIFIRLGLPCDRVDLINEARDLEILFGNLLEIACQFTNPTSDSIRRFNSRVIDALNRIITFKTIVLNELITCQLGGANYPLLIDHIRREAIRFRTILIRLQNNIVLLLPKMLYKKKYFG